MYANRRNFRVLMEIGVEELDGDVRYFTGSGNTAGSRMRNASGHNYWNSSFIMDVAMVQIPRSTERISSCWNIRCRQGAPLCSALVQVNHEIWPQETRPSYNTVYNYYAYLDIMNRLGVIRECDRQRDERTDIVSNATINYVARLTAYVLVHLILSRRLLGGPLHRQAYCSLSICLSIPRTC